MTQQLTEAYKKSADKALDWLMQQLNSDGSYGSAINDLACYYKSPYLFYISGRMEEARRVLSHIQQTFMQADGDFKTSADVKSENGALAEYWAYTNGWIALAAQKMGCFDIAYPAYRYLKSFYHKKIGGFTTRYPYPGCERCLVKKRASPYRFRSNRRNCNMAERNKGYLFRFRRHSLNRGLVQL